MQLKNVKIINPTETIENANIEIENGIIKSIKKLAGTGTQLVVPGFIDTHTHGFMGHDAMDGYEANLQISKAIVKHGVTSYLATAMTGSVDSIKKALQDIAKASEEAPNIIGIHLEGPFISIPKKGAHNKKFIIPPDEKLLEEFQTSSNGMIKKLTYAPEVSTPSFVKKQLELGIIPTVGHTNGTAQDGYNDVKLGAAAATHLWNAMTGVQNRSPGIVEAMLQSDEVYTELICDLVHVDKEAINLTIKVKGVDKVVGITDSIRPAGLPDGESTSGGLAVEKHGLKIVLKGSDTIAGSGASMHDNFVNLAKLGYSLNDVVKMTSTNASRNLGLELGEIKIGRQADLVVMDVNKFDIKDVYLKGEKWN